MTTAPLLEKQILAMYREDDAAFPEKAMKMVTDYFAGLKPSTSKIDKARLGSRVVLVSKLRSRLMEKAGPMEIDVPDKNETAKTAFNQMDAKEQLRFQAQAKASGKNRWVHDLEVMPKNIENFHVSRKDMLDYQAMRTSGDKDNLQSDVTEIDADLVLDRLCPALTNRAAKRHHIAAALLLVTGRRTGEILKTADFYLSKDQTLDGYKCMFTGQTKQGLDDVGAYEIPLLAPYGMVKAALLQIRELYPAEDLSLDDVNGAYSRSINTWVSNQVQLTPHGLRAVYAHATWELAGKKMSMIGWISKYLGHAQTNSSTFYTRIKLTKISGPWVPPNTEHTILKQESRTQWMLTGAVERKRLDGLTQMMEQRIPLSASSIGKHAGGSMQVIVRIIANNKELIDNYNASLKA